MLFNPHYDAPSLPSFEYWLESKDPHERYNYSDCNNCACAQYLKHIGQFDNRWLGRANWDDPITKMNALAGGDLEDRYGGHAHTFGALLKRVRAHRELALAR